MSATASPSDAPPPAGPGGAFGYLSETVALFVLVAIFFAILMGAMDALVVATVLPTIALDLHQVDGVTFVAGAYLITSTIAIPIFAKVSDISSRRNVFLAGLAIFIVGSALAGLSQNLTELIVFRSVQGFGGGGVFPVAIAMVAVIFPPKTRATVIGALTGAAGLAIVLGPLVGSYIVSVTTWRWVFYINLPFGVLAFLVLLLAVGPMRPTTPGRFDLVGAGLLSGWVGTLMVALVQVSDAGWAWTDPRILGLLAATAGLFALFLVQEIRSPEAIVPMRLVRRRVVAASGGMMFFTGIVFSSLITFLSVFVGIVLLQSGPNATADVRDIIYFVAVPMMLGAALAGQLLRWVPYRALAAPGLAVAGLVGIALGGLTLSSPLWVLADGILPVGGLALPLIPLGLGLGISLAVPTIAVQNDVPKDEVGTAVGFTRFLQSLGGALGISLLTVFASWRFDALAAGASSLAAVRSATVAAYDEVFLVLAACILLACACALFLTGRVPATALPRGDDGPG